MFIIGITGPSGGGKTSALRALRSLGACVIDSDAVYHELLETDKNLIAEISARFHGVVHDGVLDRKALGQIVFSDAAALEDLNAIAHKAVGAEIARLLRDCKKSGGRIAAIDAIALIESGRGSRCDVTVAVTAPPAVRVRRIMARDGVTEDYARLRISAQKPNSFYEENCDYVLVSDGATVEDFEDKCREFFAGLIGGYQS